MTRGAGQATIENACRRIMMTLKKGSFSKSELEFLLKFFQEIVKSTEKLLDRPHRKGEQNDTAS